MSRDRFSPVVPPYASTKLIAYIGNKRAILPFILEAFLELDSEIPIRRFIDPFAGSGAVARLGRSLGWEVAANDIEEYSRVVNEAWLGVSAEELPLLFAGEGGIEGALAAINAMHPQSGDAQPPCLAEPYIARHYAPRDTGAADWRRERLFYTRENAVFLDRARYAIDYSHPPSFEEGLDDDPLSRSRRAERALLLGLLVYEAATHANTSGVFKAYHKGFGGHGRDALGRILGPMRLEQPLLWEGPPSEVRQEDAAAFCSGRGADLCYLDPPYNQHQYGSNYHLLNTIARWDRRPVCDERTGDGSLVFAAGIPPSWKKSRSAFCSRSTAAGAFRALAASIDARAIVLSYNTEGLVPAEELVDILSDRAEIELRSLDYVKYRGGRQSASRLARNCEILFIARRREGRCRSSEGEELEARRGLQDLEADLRLSRALAGPFDPERFRATCGGDCLRFRRGGIELEFPSYRCLLIESGAYQVREALDRGGKEELSSLLEPLRLPDNVAACAAAADLMASGVRERRMQDLALAWLRKLAYRGYASEFRALSARLASIAGSDRLAFERLSAGLERIEEIFEARIAGGARFASGAGDASETPPNRP